MLLKIAANNVCPKTKLHSICGTSPNHRFYLLNQEREMLRHCSNIAICKLNLPTFVYLFCNRNIYTSSTEKTQIISTENNKTLQPPCVLFWVGTLNLR